MFCNWLYFLHNNNPATRIAGAELRLVVKTMDGEKNEKSRTGFRQTTAKRFRGMKSHDLASQRGALGRLLKLMREEKGLLQREVAERLGTPQSFISKYESGERRIDLPELRRICDVMETSFDRLLRRYEQVLDQMRQR